MSMTLHDIVKYLSKIFERKKDNAVSLPNDAALSSDLKRVKIGEENTPMELSKTELRVQGTINADAINVNGSAVQTGTDAGATELAELSDVTYDSGILRIQSLDTIESSGNLTLDSGGDIELNADGGDFELKDDTATIATFNSTRVYLGSPIYLKEKASQGAIGVGEGQLWTKSDTPNNLYFTDDTGTDIAITSNGKLADVARRWFITSAFYQANSNARYIPLAGGSIAEQSSLIDYTIDDTNYIVPYDLKINTIYANITKPLSSSTDPDDTYIRLFKNGSALSNSIAVDLSSVGYDTTNIHNVYTWDFSSETNTYSAGDVMQININPTNTMYYVSITVVGEYT